MTDIQQALDTWTHSLSELNNDTNTCVLNALQAIKTYADNNAPFQWEKLSTGLDIAVFVIPYCMQQQLLQTAVLLPMTQTLSHEELNTHITDPDVLCLLITIRKMNIVDATYSQKQQAEINANKQAKLRQMLLALVGDIRAVVIKLAEQRLVMSSLSKRGDDTCDHIALLARDIYAPLANRLGLYQLKWPLEDLSFRYLNADRYKTIAKGLREKRKERESFIQGFASKLAALLDKELPGTQHSIKGRAKHIFSIHKKSARKGIEPNKLFDMAAVRILLEEKEACYHVLACLHNQWEHVPEEYDDYITKPKPNGYQSIHTVVITDDERLVEIQIRTKQMDQAAELGVAAHWKYKEDGGSNKTNATAGINWLNELLNWQKEVTESTDRPNLFQDTFGNRIYVFTPQNQVIDLSIGATPIDFAYAIHTQVGHRCRGAKIGGRIVPLTHKLKTGDVVTILTQKEAQPHLDWLRADRSYVTTRSAINKIRNWFKKQNHDSNYASGKVLWDKHLKKVTIKQADTQTLVKHFNFIRFDDLIVALGSSDLHIRTVIRQLRYITGAATPQASQQTTQNKMAKSHKEGKAAITVDGIGNLMTQLGRCCHPIPGDLIIGYLTVNHGITIHHTSCRNLQGNDPKKLVRRMEAHWGNTNKHLYPAHIRVVCDHDDAVSTALWSLLSQQKIAVSHINTQTNRQRSRRFHQVVAQVTDESQLNIVLQTMTRSKGVHEATRVGLI